MGWLTNGVDESSFQWYKTTLVKEGEKVHFCGFIDLTFSDFQKRYFYNLFKINFLIKIFFLRNPVFIEF